MRSPEDYDGERWKFQQRCYGIVRSVATGTTAPRQARQRLEDVKADLRLLRGALLGEVEEIQAYYREAMGEISARGHPVLGAVAGQKWTGRARAEARRQTMREKNELLARYRYAKLAINDLIRWIDGVRREIGAGRVPDIPDAES